MVERVTVAHGGDMESQDMPSSKSRSSSDNYQDSGVTIRSGLFNKNISSADQAGDDDLIAIDGMEIKVKQAREMGLLNKQFAEDGGLSAGNAAQAAHQRSDQQSDQQQSEQTGTGNTEYDTAMAGLNDAIEEGSMEYGEAQAYDTSIAQIAMSGLSVEHAVETLDGLASGDVDATAVPSETKQMLNDIQGNVQKAATQSAKTELGREGFDVLQRAASVSPEVNAALRSYAIMRATGKADGVTWSDFLEDVQAHLNG